MENEVVDLPEENLNSEDKLNYNITEVRLLPLNKFIILTVITFGFYQIWWTYKTWKFFKEKDNLDINPVGRTFLALFFLRECLDNILYLAEEKEYKKTYNSIYLVVLYMLSSYLSRFFIYIGFLSFFCLIPAYQAFYFAIEHSEEVPQKIQHSFSGRQIALIIIGTIWWILLIIGLMSGEI